MVLYRPSKHPWASFSHWFLIFVAGFVVAHYESLLETAERLRFVSLGGAVLTTVLTFSLFGSMDFPVDLSDDWLIAKYIVYCAIRMSMVWCSILACLGFAAYHLRFTNPLLRFVNEAVYPLFILHLTVITILGYWVVALDWNLWIKYFFVTSMTILLILAAYQWLIRPFNTMRLLFGVQPKPAPKIHPTGDPQLS